MAVSSSSSKFLNKEAAPYKPLSRSNMIGWLPQEASSAVQYGQTFPQFQIYMPQYYYTHTRNAYFPSRAPFPYYACYQHPMEVYRVSKWALNPVLAKDVYGSESNEMTCFERKSSIFGKESSGMRRKWMPKKAEEKNNEVRADDIGVDFGGCTTLMLKNIPNKLWRSDLLALLDDHCKRVNEDAKDLGSGCVISAYDFVYLPVDFGKNANKGYAFVNFTSSEAAIRATREFHNLKWATLNFDRKNVHMSRKISEVTLAKFQGKEMLTEHFRKSVFACDTDEYLPVVFSPPRDGSSQLSSLQLVGRRV